MRVSHPKDVLRVPILTEESTIQTQSHNKYTFKVDPRANKREIKDAVEQHFNVQVHDVNTMNYTGKKTSRRGASTGRKANWKKAIVTLREGETIDLI